MNIAVLSGKGGAGKTTVAVGLALAFERRGRRVQLLDADVEEPNCHLLLAPTIAERHDVTVLVPELDAERCDACGVCVGACKYNAMAQVKDGVLVFPELCHSCGACVVLCPKDALREAPRAVGVVEWGTAGPLGFGAGRLNVGEPRAVPVIAALLAGANAEVDAIIDAPPGTSCPVMEIVRDVAGVCIVAEPTPFGLHDFELTAEALSEVDCPRVLVINRVNDAADALREEAGRRGISVVAELPDDARIAFAQSGGQHATSAVPGMRDLFDALAASIVKEVSTCVS